MFKLNIYIRQYVYFNQLPAFIKSTLLTFTMAQVQKLTISAFKTIDCSGEAADKDKIELQVNQHTYKPKFKHQTELKRMIRN